MTVDYIVQCELARLRPQLSKLEWFTLKSVLEESLSRAVVAGKVSIGPMTSKNPHAVALGRKGGIVRSEAKALAARENGKKGGAPKGPRKKKNPPRSKAA